MNKRLRLHRKPVPSPEAPAGTPNRRSKPKSLQREHQLLAVESARMAERVRELESFIVGSPRLEKEHRLNNVDIVPPPDFNFALGGEHLSEGQRMSYARQERLQQMRQRNLVIFLALLAAAIAFGIWFMQFIR